MDTRLVIANLTRWRLLAFVTVSTVAVAFFLFGLLLALNRVFNAGINVDKADRLVVANSVSLMQGLPLAYLDRIADVEGVEVVSPNVFFGGWYQEPRNALMAMATDPERFVRILPEALFKNAADRQHWLDDRTTIAVGRALADKYHWTVGDLVPLQSAIYPRKDGDTAWVFRVAAIYDASSSSGNTNSLLMHYAYLDEERANAKHTVGWFNVKVRDPRKNQDVARRIDALFANSSYETHSANEAAFAQELMRQVGDFSLIIRLAITAVFLTLVLVTANAMIHSVNERVGEIATLKSLGASDARVAITTVAEALAMIAAGGILGLAACAWVLPHIAAYSQTLVSIAFAWSDIAWTALAVVGVTLVISALPARQAWRVETGTALGRVA